MYFTGFHRDDPVFAVLKHGRSSMSAKQQFKSPYLNDPQKVQSIIHQMQKNQRNSFVPLLQAAAIAVPVIGGGIFLLYNLLT